MLTVASVIVVGLLLSPAYDGWTTVFEDDDDVDDERLEDEKKNDDIDLCLLCGWDLRVVASPIISDPPIRSRMVSISSNDTAM